MPKLNPGLSRSETCLSADAYPIVACGPNFLTLASSFRETLCPTRPEAGRGENPTSGIKATSRRPRRPHPVDVSALLGCFCRARGSNRTNRAPPEAIPVTLRGSTGRCLDRVRARNFLKRLGLEVRIEGFAVGDVVWNFGIVLARFVCHANSYARREPKRSMLSGGSALPFIAVAIFPATVAAAAFTGSLARCA